MTFKNIKNLLPLKFNNVRRIGIIKNIVSKVPECGGDWLEDW